MVQGFEDALGSMSGVVVLDLRLMCRVVRRSVLRMPGVDMKTHDLVDLWASGF